MGQRHQGRPCGAPADKPGAIWTAALFSETYEELFRCIQAEYSAEDIHAYYYDIPFEETLRRHETKPNRADFGPEAMRDWWKEKDYIGYLPEKILTQTMTLEDAGARILADVQAR